MREAVVHFWEGDGRPTLEDVANPDWLRRHSARPTAGEALTDLFERRVEAQLIQPTIIYDYPVETSPLSKNKPEDPAFVERFEIYAAGMEIGNAYTELNDPQEQRRRFEMQIAMRERGDEEAHQMDEDYVRALAYGMPPTGGEGIGIDRLTMILTGCRSIRDVILFPLLRPEGPIGLAAQLRELDKPVNSRFELFIAGRYLRARRKQAVISVITAISMRRRGRGRDGADYRHGRQQRLPQHAPAQPAGRHGAHQRARKGARQRHRELARAGRAPAQAAARHGRLARALRPGPPRRPAAIQGRGAQGHRPEFRAGHQRHAAPSQGRLARPLARPRRHAPRHHPRLAHRRGHRHGARFAHQRGQPAGRADALRRAAQHPPVPRRRHF